MLKDKAKRLLGCALAKHSLKLKEVEAYCLASFKMGENPLPFVRKILKEGGAEELLPFLKFAYLDIYGCPSYNADLLIVGLRCENGTPKECRIFLWGFYLK